jgi:hypothetical protein
MGWPLTAAAVIATVLLVRWAQKNEDSDRSDPARDAPGPPAVDTVTPEPPAR